MKYDQNSLQHQGTEEELNYPIHIFKTQKVAWSFCWYICGRSIFRNIFEREMLVRTEPTIRLQIV